MRDDEMSDSSLADESRLPPAMGAETAAALIASAFPDIDTTAVRRIGGWWLFDVFRTSDDWVFRFPRQWWCGTLFEPEALTHEFVAKVLPARIRLPLVRRIAEPSTRYPYRFAGHHFVPGVAADSVAQALLPSVARDIAEFLGALHSVPESVAKAAGFHQLTGDDPGRREWFEEGMATSLLLRGLDPVIDSAIEWLHTERLTQSPLSERQLVHTSLDPDHLLVDPATGSLIGVLDWTDASIGDAARDFVNLVTWRGWEFAEEVLALYPLRVDNEFRARLRWMAQWLSLIWLAHVHRQGRDLTTAIAGVHNAFAPNDFQVFA